MNFGAVPFPISLSQNEFGWKISPLGSGPAFPKRTQFPVSARGETNPMDATPARRNEPNDTDLGATKRTQWPITGMAKRTQRARTSGRRNEPNGPGTGATKRSQRAPRRRDKTKPILFAPPWKNEPNPRPATSSNAGGKAKPDGSPIPRDGFVESEDSTLTDMGSVPRSAGLDRAPYNREPGRPRSETSSFRDATANTLCPKRFRPEIRPRHDLHVGSLRIAWIGACLWRQW
jgi:hypothetical protein